MPSFSPIRDKDEKKAEKELPEDSIDEEPSVPSTVCGASR